MGEWVILCTGGEIVSFAKYKESTKEKREVVGGKVGTGTGRVEARAYYPLPCMSSLNHLTKLPKRVMSVLFEQYGIR